MMIIWAVFLISLGISFGTLQDATTIKDNIGQGLSIMLLFYGSLILIGSIIGNVDPLRPLANSNQIEHSLFITVKSLDELQKVLVNSKGKKPVLLDFYADWCHSCQVMENTVFKDPNIRKTLKNFVVVKVDVTANGENENAILKQYNIVAPPIYVFIDKNGSENSNLRLVGVIPVDQFLKQLEKIK